MNDKLTVDVRALARKLFVITNWVLLTIVLVIAIYSISRGYDSGGITWLMYGMLTVFVLPYIVYYIAFRLSKRSSKSGDVMAVISSVSSLLILAAVAYYIVFFTYFYINGSMRV